MATKKEEKKTEGQQKNNEHIDESNGFTFTDKKGFGESIGASISTEKIEALKDALHDFVHEEAEPIKRKSVELYTFLESKPYKALGITLKTPGDYFMLGYLWDGITSHSAMGMEIKGRGGLLELLLLKSLLS